MAPRPSASPRAVARRVAKLTASQYQLRIELKHVEPLVWRRVLVPRPCTVFSTDPSGRSAWGPCG